MDSTHVLPCLVGVKSQKQTGLSTWTDALGHYAFDWGSGGRRFKSCQPDWEVEASGTRVPHNVPQKPPHCADS